ncbi:MAG: helix-turn-helix transcriptional regulator [Armatimonadota bacterium]|nr:helix-turn-helix domain-containing protein [bacterium]
MGIPALPFCHVQLHAQKPLPRAYPTELKTLGDYIRKRRLDLGLLQKDVAQILGVTEASVFYWETHRASPRARYASKIMEFLGYLP